MYFKSWIPNQKWRPFSPIRIAQLAHTPKKILASGQLGSGGRVAIFSPQSSTAMGGWGVMEATALGKKHGCTVETTYSDHSYSDQQLVWIKKLGTESFLYKCCLNNLLIVIK